MSTMWVVALLAGLMFFIGWAAVRAVIARGTREYAAEAARLAAIASLPMQEAEVQAVKLLESGQRFEVASTGVRPINAGGTLPPHLTAVLARFSSIEPMSDRGTIVGLAYFGPSALRQGLVRIGIVASGTDVEGELAIAAGSESIYELYPDEAVDGAFGTYPSIYHWIIAVAADRTELKRSDQPAKVRNPHE